MPSLPSRKLRAPEADSAALIDPPLTEAARVVAANRLAANDWDRLSGAPLSKWREMGRLSLIATAALRAGEKSIPVTEQEAIRRASIFTGHQPELFHPGVWFKNFLASSIAKEVAGQAFNLVVDNDVMRSASIRVPTQHDGVLTTVEIPFDQSAQPAPWSARDIVDLDMFRRFPTRVREALGTIEMRGGRKQILLDRLWQRVLSLLERIRLLQEQTNDMRCKLTVGACFSEARHHLEQEMGLAIEECSLCGNCCDTGYQSFLSHLLMRAEELHTRYNEALAEYRQVNHLRSRSRPVPDLVRDGDWHEVPLWIWSWNRPERRRAFVRRVGESWELTDREGIVTGPSVPEADKSGRIPWQTYPIHGLSVFPRALITTMYARLVLSDLFIHGIGGAKYDELTDEIIRRFFAIEPPRYLTATATFRLPIERPSVTFDDVRDTSQALRDVRYRPETLVGHPLVASDPVLERELLALAAEKRDYLRSHTLRRGSPEVFAGLDRINASMNEKLQTLTAHLRDEHARLLEQLQQARTLGSREFSFVLYPEEYLVPRLLALASAEK